MLTIGDITGYDDAEVVDRKEYMKIKVMPLDTQTFTTYECDDFEFRSNNVCNWVRIMKDGKEIAFIERVGVIKTISHDAEVIYCKCSKCVNANNPVVCSWIMKDIAEEKGCDFWQDSSEDITHTET